MIECISKLVSARYTGTPSTANAVPLPDKGGVGLSCSAAYALPVSARHTGTPSTAIAVPLPDKGGVGLSSSAA